MVMSSGPTYLPELAQYIEDKLENPTALIAALAALLGDPEIYGSAKGRPTQAFTDFVHELLLRDRELGAFMGDQKTPISRSLIKGKWSADWHGLRRLSAKEFPTPKFDVCISFAGEDREVAGRIASLIKRNRMKRRVFYDDFEKVTIWGKELASYLHKIYSEQSMLCVILFSHAYSRKVWTRYEYRAALTRVVQEQGSYVLPVALDVTAMPEEFESLGYWPFKSGDERKIAKAVEEKINERAGRWYASLEELTEIFNIDIVARALLGGFRAGIEEKKAAGDYVSAHVLTVLALISAADLEHVDPSARAVIDLVLFAPGPVGDSFEGEAAKVVGTASVYRALGAHGPLFFNQDGWEVYFEPYRHLEDEDETIPEDKESDSGDDN
jgi:hypothetical protein